MGYTREELQALKIYDLDEDYNEKKWESLWAKLKEKKNITVETQQKKKDGTLIDVFITANYVKYGDLELNCSFVQDITEKKKQEEELQLFDFTFRNSSLPTYYITEDASFYDYNEAGCKQLGYTKEEFKALNVFNTAIGQDETSYSLLWGEMKEKCQINFDAQQKRKDGTLIDVNIICSYVKFGEKELNCAYVVDITKKKKQEEQLKLLDYSYKHTDSAMFFLDVNGLYIDFNQATANMLGYSHEEFEGKTLMDVNPLVTKEYWVNRWEELKDTPNQKFEVKFKRKDGTFIDVAVSTNSIELNGKIVNFGFYKDITEKKKLEEKLKLLDYSYKHTDSAMFFLDVNGLYIDFNQATANMLGYSHEEFEGKTLMDVNPLVTKEYWAERCGEFKEISNHNFQVKLKKKDGTLIDIEVNTNSIELNGAFVIFGFYKDITEKKKLEDNLKLSAFTIENAAWGLAYVKADGTLYNCNLAFAKMYGNTSREEMMTKIASDFGSAYTTDSWKQYWDELKQKKNLHYIVKRTKKDGTTIDVEINANMIQFVDLELNCVYVNDVTEKIKAENDLKQSNQRYEYATLATSDVVWEADLLKHEIFISKNFTTFFGHPVAQTWMPMENDVWIQNINRDDIDIVMKERYAVLNSKESNNRWTGEYRLRKADGSYATVLDKTFAIKNEEGTIIRMVGALQDITKQRVEQERLRLMESVILNTNDSILITEAEPYDLPRPRILFVNKAFTEMTGYSAEEVIGKTPRILQNEDTDRKELDRLYTSLKNWEPCEVTVSNSKKNGEKFWLNMQITPIANEKGWFTHWIAIERDVTKQKEADEEKEKLLKELVENNLELKQFSYITTHNLRAPLTNLISICDIIEPGIGTDELTLQLIEGFKTSTHHLNETLKDLIEILIIKENRNIQKGQLTFEDIFKKVSESLSMSLLKNKVIINADFSAAPSVIFANAYLESIFLNLLTNAVKYRHPDRDPIITIKTNKEPNGDTKLTFSDNGIGINMALAKDKIFGLYKRFHKNSDSKGIGLYLIHSQLTSHGGKIEVDSEVNIGTTFTIIFK